MVVTSKRCFAFHVLISKAQIWKKKFLSWKIDKFTLFTHSLVGWNLDNLYKHAVMSFFFYLSWHFKQEKFIFWKESFFAKQELITHARLCVPDFTTGIRISLLISDIMTKSLAFFWGKLHVICKLSKLFPSYICIWPDINTRGVRRILDSYADRIFPTPVLFVSGYTNTENVF